MKRYLPRNVCHRNGYAIFFFKFPLFSLSKTNVASDFSRVSFKSGNSIKWNIWILIFYLQGYIEGTHFGVESDTNPFMCLRIVRPHPD